jgi:hypothetical protein
VPRERRLIAFEGEPGARAGNIAHRCQPTGAPVDVLPPTTAASLAAVIGPVPYVGGLFARQEERANEKVHS